MWIRSVEKGEVNPKLEIVREKTARLVTRLQIAWILVKTAVLVSYSHYIGSFFCYVALCFASRLKIL
jgi:hypothetical protein